MSQVFEGYERQCCELSANLTKKCTSASLLDGVSEIKAGLDDAEALIRKMDLEARSLPPNVKATLLAKLREYKSDINNLKTEVKRITSVNTNLASGDQRQRLMMSTERLNQSSDRIRQGRKVMLETEELGVSILQDLHQQRQSLLHAHDTLHGVDDNTSRSKKILTTMSRRMSRNKWIIGSIIAVLVFAILFILYFKLSHQFNGQLSVHKNMYFFNTSILDSPYGREVSLGSSLVMFRKTFTCFSSQAIFRDVN
ncbi:hypothetical protein K7X08_000043 [Anisodus acutangulus]|uniref:Vesicle transport v-SNARE N-terminal domain-containing protein n=1 Tax=Anisodus acutangulus TaxID=402998 RepID=A0A9Q1RAL3_9SOLA|nr:hypothetical protein K7X08_000043 [Anisodus acutangulus]